MYEIPINVYDELACKICSSLSTIHYFNGTVTADDGEADHTLRATIIIYRRRVSVSDDELDTIIDAVPVWWECHTLTDDGEVCNDFDFALLRDSLIGR
ncbi:MAG: hypothetical protein IIV91_00500 [Alistipes sp.]|jgi:hypothetical protein|nr:hypothetical protein [Alistipes sp.]